MLVGASLDQSIKQLPARRRIGALAFSAYSRSADLGPGILWYATLGIGAALLTVAAAVAAVAARIASPVTVPLVVAAGLSLLHSLATARAAPTNFSQRHVPQTEEALEAVFTRFARWQALRASLQVLTLGATLWALIAWCTLA
jgi:hypothetical protein